ncbi:MAG: NAD-dependent epimerase/dehydratase family protein [Sphingomonadaceae bacterium]
MKLAVTGGTGFVGRHLITLALAKKHEVRALARSPQKPMTGLEWIEGAIDPALNLDRLVDGVDAVIHVAGAINAPDRAGFAACNIDGTAALLAAAQNAGVGRFVHVSSLAAREPALSDYGWSKAESERRVEASGLAWTIVRPPAVYGPGDREMLELFRMAKRGFMVMPPEGRLSIIEVSDLSRLLLACARQDGGARKTYEVDDGTVRGLTHKDFATAIGEAVGKRVVVLSAPAALLHGTSALDRLLRGKNAKLTRDRVRYFCHPDWVSRRSMAPPVRLWKPKVPARDGLRATADAYRAAGWL